MCSVILMNCVHRRKSGVELCFVQKQIERLLGALCNPGPHIKILRVIKMQSISGLLIKDTSNDEQH